MKLRRGIGAIILDKNGDVIVFQRRDFPESWQSPEGGVDEGETPIEALVRELYEEVNLKKDEYAIIGETKEFIPYLFDSGKKFGFDGQEKKFYLVKLKADKEFKFDNTDEIEFMSSKIIKAKDILERIPTFKKEMYEKVLREFEMI